ncbi:MAG: metal ABC transporter ATP-binding protein [Actinomycetota bacterium]|nr:metal ABC transporter ATP-binding protein [Actinomycetota bacterium]
MSRPAVLELDQVVFGYGRVPVLQAASLRVHEGEFVAVVGANGSGKTTLLRLALGLIQPSRGSVSLFGTPVRRFRDWGRVGYVPQRASTESALPLSVEEVVRTGLAGSLGLLRRPDAAQRARLEQVLDLMDLAGLRGQPVGRLSGGQQQRALIARALVTAPALLMLDEPTTGVDPSARTALREVLERLVRQEGVAVVYVSHDPEGFTGLSDRVVEVRAGRVEAVDTVGLPGNGSAGIGLGSPGAGREDGP